MSRFKKAVIFSIPFILLAQFILASNDKKFPIQAHPIKTWKEFKQLPKPILNWIENSFGVSSESEFEKWHQIDEKAEEFDFIMAIPVNYGGVAWVVSVTDLRKEDSPKAVSGVLLTNGKEPKLFDITFFLEKNAEIVEARDKNENGLIEIEFHYFYEGDFLSSSEWTGAGFRQYGDPSETVQECKKIWP